MATPTNPTAGRDPDDIKVERPHGVVTDVLIVDDDAGCRNVLRRCLTTAGFEVHEARDGDEGLRIFYARQIDAILTDVRMPKMSGITLALACRKISPQVPIIAITGAINLPPSRCQELADAGVEILTKPCSGSDILAALGRACERTPS